MQNDKKNKPILAHGFCGDEMKITLKAARVNAGLTIREVAEVVSKNKNTIVSWELGKTKISQQDFEQLCELYKIDQKFVKQS